jgi:cyclopropane fatty-acyl-phospholipid synthase-like methyltransferase
MIDMLRIIGNQFKKPTGLLGKIISKIMIKGNSPDYDKIIPELDIKQNDSILEIGYGHGLGVNRISSDYDCHITGIDFSELMFREATKRNKKNISNKKVELKLGDFLKFEIIPDQYDKVFCVNVIYFWDNLVEPFTKIKTGLKDNGVLCLFMAKVDFIKKMKFTKDGIFNKYSLDQVVDELKIAGFEKISYTAYNKGYIIKCKK